MAKKKTTTTKKSPKAAKADATPQAIKFAKGVFYEDAKGNLWHCVNPKPKKTPDGHMVVLMQKTEDGVQVGDAGEEYTDTFVKQLTKAELKEYRAACQREREALAETAAREGDQATQPADESVPAPAKKPRAKKEKPPKEKRVSCLDAAATVLVDSSEPMGAMEMIEAMATRGLWSSPGGATPHATLYAAIIREIAKKGADARFTKTDRGRFTANAVTTPADATPAEAPVKPAKKGKRGGKAIADGTPGPKAVSELFQI